jgi:hypothetical protein
MNALIEVAPELGVSATCTAFGVARATYYRKRAPMLGPKLRRTSPARRLCDAERAVVLALLVFVMPVAAQADAEPTRSGPSAEGDDFASSQKWRQQAGDYEQAPAAIPKHRSEPRHWYGWQTVGLDVLWLSSLSLAGVFDIPGLAWASFGVGLLGVPLIHLAHSTIHRLESASDCA